MRRRMKEFSIGLGIVVASVGLGAYIDLSRQKNRLEETPIVQVGLHNGGYMLSNGMDIPNSQIIEIDKFDEGKKIIVNADNLDSIEIFDEGDGKPYFFTQQEGMDGLVKNYDLKYTACQQEFPVWNPLAFRQTPCYSEELEDVPGDNVHIIRF